MYKLIRFWHQNKNQIIKVLAVIVFIFLVIQVINLIMRKQNDKKIDDAKKVENQVTNVNNENNKGLVSEKSAVTGQEVSKSELKKSTNVIYSFVKYCNDKDLENAYNLLTEDCKQAMYNSLDSFNQAYYRNVFNGQKKNCTIENWVGDIYKVNLTDDILATGKDTGYSKQDYMTVEQIDGDYKLNINNYIGHTNINKTTTNDNITIQVISKDTYMDEEEYTIKVTNKNDEVLQLDTVNSAKSLYLEDSKGGKYSYYNHELTDQTLAVESGQTKELKIKFYSSYVSTKNINYMVFSNMVLKGDELSKGLEFRASL